MAMKNQLEEYVSMTLDRAFAVEAFCPDLPLHMLRYDFFRGRLLGLDLVFAIVRDDVQNAREYGRMAQLLKAEFACPVVFVFKHLATPKRNALIAHGVAFVVPKWQLFLPPNLHLNERPPAAKPFRKSMRPTSQAFLIRQIVCGDIEGKTCAHLSMRFGYTKMTISNVISDLASIGVVEVKGWPHTICFNARGRELWDGALPYLASPVKRTIPNKLNPSSLCRAGISALSDYTMIAPDPIPAYACTVEESQSNKICIPEEYEGDARSSLQVWRYNPRICGGGRVDRLSLFLSLRNVGDPRIAAELDVLLEDMAW
jgi:hypothetical protein